MYLISTFLALTIAVSFYGYSKLDLQKILSLLTMISKAMKESSKNSCNVKVEKGLCHIEVGNKNLVLPTFKSVKHYDILCFKKYSELDLIINEDENHNLSLNVKDEHKIPFTLIRNNEHFAHVPFKPSDHSLDEVFVAIKHLTKDGYSVYKFNENDFINFSVIVNRYEEDLKKESEKPVELAEVFEED
jgi:hypothetical protein